MSTETIRKCDQCGEKIGGKTWEFGGFVAIVNGGRREVTATKECCSQRCVTLLVAGLLRDVEAAPGTDCHALGGAA